MATAQRLNGGLREIGERENRKEKSQSAPSPRGDITTHLVKLVKAKSLCALTEAATADVHVVLVDDTVHIAADTAASTFLTLTLVVGVAVIESGVTHSD